MTHQRAKYIRYHLVWKDEYGKRYSIRNLGEDSSGDCAQSALDMINWCSRNEYEVQQCDSYEVMR